MVFSGWGGIVVKIFPVGEYRIKFAEFTLHAMAQHAHDLSHLCGRSDSRPVQNEEI